MVYGPIAAMLVEMFPTRIRYTSMSLPYHIGNGWFGGLLPTTAFAIVAATGNMYNGLWYPIIIAGDDASSSACCSSRRPRTSTSTRSDPDVATLHRPGRLRKRRPFFLAATRRRGAAAAAQANSAACCSRSRFFCTLPIALRGSSATTKQRLGTLKLAIFALSARDQRVAVERGARRAATTTATTASPKSACGTPTTALSATPGSSLRTPSISAG